MNILAFINIIIYSWGFVEVAKRLRRGSPALWLRIPAAFICLYVTSIYVLVLFGVITQFEITYYMRWFHLVIASYIILEARHG